MAKSKFAPRYEFIETENENTSAVECHLAGVTFGKRQGSLMWLSNIEKKGDVNDIAIILRREPNNETDPNAIRVAAHGKSVNSYGISTYNGKYGDLGYLPMAVAAKLAPLMDAGKWVEVEDWHTVGRASKNSSVGMVITLTWDEN